MISTTRVRPNTVPSARPSVCPSARPSVSVFRCKAVPTYYDDEFKATSSTTQCPVLETSVRDGDTGDEAVLWQSSGSRFVQVFSGTKKIFGEDAIAVEAMSSEADAWNNMQGVNLIQAGETWDGSFGVRLQ